MQQIQKIDSELTRVFAEFKNLAKNLVFDEICELSDEVTILQQSYPGIYKIDIHVGDSHDSFDDWYNWFHGQWVTEEYKRKFVPNPKKKRVAIHLNNPLSTWIPLYLGRSRNIASRVREHISLSIHQPTTALKLAARSNMTNQKFRLSTLCIKVENYDLIMPQIEKFLRDFHNPILGRQ